MAQRASVPKSRNCVLPLTWRWVAACRGRVAERTSREVPKARVLNGRLTARPASFQFLSNQTGTIGWESTALRFRTSKAPAAFRPIRWSTPSPRDNREASQTHNKTEAQSNAFLFYHNRLSFDKHLERSQVAQRFPRTMVQQMLNANHLRVGNLREVGLFLEKLTR